MEPIEQAQAVLTALAARHLTVAVAEGDTGGLLLAWLTAVPGSSAAVLGGVVAYHDELKRRLLGVDAARLAHAGAVSAETVEAMAEGMRERAGADLGVATTGIAGPGGARGTKPVGLAFVAVVGTARRLVRAYQWRGDRQANRAASAQAALGLVLELLGADLDA